MPPTRQPVDKPPPPTYYLPIMANEPINDGRRIAFSMGQDRYWPPFCKALGRSDLTEDARFSTSEPRYENREELVRLLDKIFISKTRDEWEQALLGN